jgi:hypothetical protein
MKHSKGHYNIKLYAKVQRENEKETKQWQNIYIWRTKLQSILFCKLFSVSMSF